MTEALERIAAYFVEFCRSVDDCRRSADPFRSEQWKGAQSALGRLRNRYLREKRYLSSAEQVALRKVFEEDVFIKGMMQLRQVAEHVILPEGPLIYTIGNAPVQLTADSSALAVFADAIVRLPDNKGVFHTIDHLQRLEETGRRISRAFVQARRTATEWLRPFERLRKR
jgi:hypothetical protein